MIEIMEEEKEGQQSALEQIGDCYKEARSW